MNIALFAPIEGDLKDINTQSGNYERYFEKEAIKAFKCWRQNGGWLKDIPIYAICPTKATISEETKQAFADLNVTYIEAYEPETETYLCGFWNIPLVGMWAENNLTEDVLIKIDLDMYLIKPLKPEWFVDLDKTIVGIHDFKAHPYLHKMSTAYPEFGNFFNTGFTISKRSSGFFHEQMQALIEMEDVYDQGRFEQVYGIKVGESSSRDEDNEFEYDLLEELCVSIMYRDGFPIIPLANFYLETEEYELDDEEIVFNLNEIYFIHEHIDTNLDREKLTNKIRYRKVLKDIPGYEFFFTT